MLASRWMLGQLLPHPEDVVTRPGSGRRDLRRRGKLEGRKVSGVLRLDPLSVATLLAERRGQLTPTPAGRRV